MKGQGYNGAPTPPVEGSIKSAARATGIPFSTLQERMQKRGMTLAEACAVAVTSSRESKAPWLRGRGGRNGGRKEPTFDRYFINCVRAVIGKDPIDSEA